MNKITATEANQLAPNSPEGEGTRLAEEMAEAWHAHMNWYAEYYKVPVSEAIAIDAKYVEENEETVRRLATKPSKLISHFDLQMIGRVDKNLAAQTWQRMKAEARKQRASGSRSLEITQARGVEHTPWEQAQRLAVLDELREEYNPNPGSAGMLVQNLAYAQFCCEIWLSKHFQQLSQWETNAYLDEDEGEAVRGRTRGYKRKSHGEMIRRDLDQSAAMFDRFQRMIQRAARTLRDEKPNQAVLIQNAEQVNVGQQQVNLSVQNEDAGQP